MPSEPAQEVAKNVTDLTENEKKVLEKQHRIADKIIENLDEITNLLDEYLKSLRQEMQDEELARQMQRAEAGKKKSKLREHVTRFFSDNKTSSTTNKVQQPTKSVRPTNKKPI